MKHWKSNLLTLPRLTAIAAIGGLFIVSLSTVPCAHAQDRDDDRDRGEHSRPGSGINTGIGIGLGILQNLPPSNNVSNPGTSTRTGTTQRHTVAKKGDPPSKIPPAKPPDYTVHKNDGPECPMRGKGCAALIINFYTAEEGNITEFKKEAEQICGKDKIDYVAPNIQALLDGIDGATKENAESLRKQYTAELASVAKIIRSHQAKVRDGVELAMEFTFGHGGLPAADKVCGTVGSHSDGTVRRGNFSTGNYHAAYDNACTWFVMDTSCFSGYMAMAVDELENNGEAHCTTEPASKDSCNRRAAWGGDIAMGSAKAKATCSGDAVKGPIAKVAKIFTDEFARAGKTENVDLGNIRKGLTGVTDDSASYYKDQGYHFCSVPPLRGGHEWRAADPADQPASSPSPAASPAPSPESPAPSGR